MDRITVPFFKVRKDDRNAIAKNMRTYTEGGKRELTVELAKTAIKSVVGIRGRTVCGDICGVPNAVDLPMGPGLYIPLKGTNTQAFTTIAQLQKMIRA